MKIGIYDMYLDALGGGEKYMLSIASCLSKKHDVELFWDDETILTRASKRFPLDLTKITIKRNIFLSALSFFQKKKIMSDYDLIIYLSDGSIPFLFGKKNMLHFQFPTPWVKGQKLSTKVKLSQIHKIVCNSFYTKNFIDKTFNVSSEILYPPCSLITSSERKENIILTVGRLNIISKHNDFKKLEKMMDIFRSTIAPKYPTWKFIVVVTYLGEDKKIVDEWKGKLEGSSIEIMSNVEYAKLTTLYSKAKIYWHAAGFEEDLEKNPERAEHFGIAPVEAMSAGAVPIVINAGGIPEIVTDGVDGLVWNSVDELVEKTAKVIMNDIYRNELAKAAIETSKTFSEKAFEQKLFTIIDAL